MLANYVREAIGRALSRLPHFHAVTSHITARPAPVRKACAYIKWWVRFNHELLWGKSESYRRIARLPYVALETLRTVGGLRQYAPALRKTRIAKTAKAERLVVMLVISDLRIDPRVERAARTLVVAGYQVRVLFPDMCNPRFAESPITWGPGIEFWPLETQAGTFIMHFPWIFGDAILKAALQQQPYAFHCHDLNTCMMGLAAAKARSAYCVCDFHEWFSENVSWNAKQKKFTRHPWPMRKIFQMGERLVLRQADAVITVCDSIAEELDAMSLFGHRKVEVIRNIPPLKHSGKQYPSLKAELGLPPDRFLLLWQGGTGPSRLLEPIIEALALLPNVTFVIRGPSLDLFGEEYRGLAARVGAADRLILLPPVPSADVVNAANGADAGIWTLPNLSKNFYYALPNKIFEYMAAGLPVLAANYPEARKMVEGNGVGLCFDPYAPESIAGQIRRIAEEPGLAERIRGAIPLALARIQADEEWDKLAALYHSLETSGRAE